MNTPIRNFAGHAAIACLFATATACTDGTTVDRGHRGPPADVSQVDNPSAQLARARLARSNPSDWLGTNHNLLMDDFRRELKKPGILTRNMCGYLVDLTSRGDRLPSRYKSHAPLGVGSARSVASTSALCKPKQAPGVTALVATPEQEEFALSSTATSLLEQVQTATEAAEDAGDLAVRLTQVLDNSAVISEIEREIVQSAAAVAQHSFEYWQTALPAFQQELLNEYGPCIQAQRDAGAGRDDARSACLEGGSPATVSAPLEWPGTAPVLRLHAMPPECGLGKNFRKLVGADVAGAITGAVRGALTAGWAGVIPGALAGAAIGSLGSFLVSTWDLFWCAME